MTYSPIIRASRISRGYGYITGGNTGADSLTTSEKYDDVTNAWKVVTAILPIKRRDHVGFSLNGYGYVTGGWNGSGFALAPQKYTDTTDTFTAIAVLNTPRIFLTGFSLNGYGYTVGGYVAATSAITEKYDDIANTNTAKANLNTARFDLGGFSLNGYGYTVGGYAAAASAITEKYDDISNTWTNKANVDTPQNNVTTFSLNGCGYTSSYDASCRRYDDIANTWTKKANYNTASSSTFPLSLNGYGYAVAGDVGIASLITQKYDDVLNTWTAKANINTARYKGGAFSIGNLQESIQNPQITQILKTNIRLRANECMVTKSASANARNSHDAETTTTSATYTKKKTITFHLGLIGGYRVLFDLKTSDVARHAFGRVYRNGVSLGTEQEEFAIVNTYVTKSEDLTTSLSPGDTLELWLHNDGTGTTTARNFQIAYDDSATVAVQSANS